jgi:hypothetical protein
LVTTGGSLILPDGQSFLEPIALASDICIDFAWRREVRDPQPQPSAGKDVIRWT